MSSAGENDDAVAGDGEEDDSRGDVVRARRGGDGSTDAGECDEERVFDEFSVLMILPILRFPCSVKASASFEFYCFSFAIRKLFVGSDLG